MKGDDAYGRRVAGGAEVIFGSGIAYEGRSAAVRPTGISVGVAVLPWEA